MTTYLPHMLFLLLLIGMPTYDYFDTRRLRRSKDPGAKVGGYQRTIAVLWGLTVLALVVAPFETLSQPPSPEALTWLPSPGWTWVMALILVLVFCLPFLQARFHPATAQAIRQQLERNRFFVPITHHERRWWIPLSLSAAICEEIVYRGFLIRYLDDLPLGASSASLPLVSSVLLAAGIFGLAHGYQGIFGILTTTAAGLLFAFFYYASGALWLPILLHALLDLRLLLVPAEVPGEASPAPPATDA